MDSTKDTFKYLTIKEDGIGEFKDRGSKFIGFAYHVENEEEVAQYIEILKKEHLKSRHHCYAYILDRGEKYFRANDDGEPSGTAGKPILGQIKSANLKETLVVVVRYFGGTKLGTSGLINAYKTAAQEAIKAANVVEVTLRNTYRLSIDYSDMGHVLNCIKEMDLDITNKVFEANAIVDIKVDSLMCEPVLTRLKAKLLQVSIEEINEETEIPFCTIECLESYD